MDVLSDKPQDVGIESKKAAERDMIDLNHEIAGVETGRIKRFLNEGSLSFSGETKKEKAAREFRTMLDMLLAEDPIYATLYKQVTEKIEKAQQAVNLALVDISQRLKTSDRKLQLLRDNAAESPDGTKIFQSNDSSIYTEHGKRLAAKELENIVIPENASSWEVFDSEKDEYDALLRDKKKLTDYKTDTLGDINRRMKDRDNPLSKEELEDLQKNFPKLPELETKSINMPASYKVDTLSAARVIAPDTNKPKTPLTPTFEKAHDGMLDLAELDAVKFKNTVIPVV